MATIKNYHVLLLILLIIIIIVWYLISYNLKTVTLDDVNISHRSKYDIVIIKKDIAKHAIFNQLEKRHKKHYYDNPNKLVYEITPHSISVNTTLTINSHISYIIRHKVNEHGKYTGTENIYPSYTGNNITKFNMKGRGIIRVVTLHEAYTSDEA